MTTASVQRDERTTVIENTSYRWAYLFLSFGLLLIVAYRSFVHQESSWDLLGLVVLGGLVSTAYQALHRVLNRQWVVITLVTILAAGLVAAVTAMLR
jgi:hypothetical protein